MKNDKTVDPRDKKSTKVIQLETAMGAAISCFEGPTLQNTGNETAKYLDIPWHTYILN